MGVCRHAKKREDPGKANASIGRNPKPFQSKDYASGGLGDSDVVSYVPERSQSSAVASCIPITHDATLKPQTPNPQTSPPQSELKAQTSPTLSSSSWNSLYKGRAGPAMNPLYRTSVASPTSATPPPNNKNTLGPMLPKSSPPFKPSLALGGPEQEQEQEPDQEQEQDPSKCGDKHTP